MSFAFTNPWAWLLWPFAAAFFILVARRSLADLSPLRRNVAVGLRLLVLTFLVAALSGLQSVHTNRDLSVMFVVDFSDSVDAKTKDAAVKYIDQVVAPRNGRKSNDKWGVVVFGREAFIDLAPGNAPTLGRILTVAPTEFTDIAAAIRLALAVLPENTRKRLVILSDGNENLGDALAEAGVARSNDVAVDIVPLSSPQQREVLLEAVTVPAEAKIGQPVDVRVLVRSTVDTDATVRLFRNGRYIGNRSVALSAGRNAFTFPQAVNEPGTANFEAQIEVPKGADTQAENNRGLGFTIVAGKPTVLLIDDDASQSRFLFDALKKEKVNVERRSSAQAPRELRDMQRYDAIILGDVPAWQMTEKQMFALQSYVRDLGCGLVMVGGPSSFGPGGYRSTPIEEALPVTMDIKNQQVIPGGAVAMVMHSCEFEGGNDWAKSVCSQVTRQLGENDYAGLVIFGFKANWVYPMLKVGPSRTKMLADIRGINPGDMPDFDAALEVCYQGLVKTPAQLKHIIILSDGDPSPPAPDLVNRLNAAKITISTVVIQPHDGSGDRNMKRIALQHGGNFYKVTNPKAIPNIFLKEAATISRSAIIEGPFTPRFGDEGASVKGISSLPPLLGYVGTSVKSTAQQVLASQHDDPILATWQYGLGRGVAFTSDTRPRWAANWIGWPSFSKFWAQTVRWSMRQNSTSDLQTNVEIDRGRGKVSIEAVDKNGNLLNFLSPKARLVTPDLKGRDLALDQVGPGRYEALFEARQLGSYLVNIQTKSNNKGASQVTGAALPYSPEYAAVGSNEPLLRRLADETGGDKLDLDKPRGVFDRARAPVSSPRDLWLPLLALAALLFPLDVAARRLLWDDPELLGRFAFKRRRNSAPDAAPNAAPTRNASVQAAKNTRTRATPGASTSAAPPSTPPPASTSAPRGSTSPPPASTSLPLEEEVDSMERLRRAKRRARGED
jgi:uncharacterized membrane protein/Mg-chelatase subunit ChlD